MLTYTHNYCPIGGGQSLPASFWNSGEASPSYWSDPLCACRLVGFDAARWRHVQEKGSHTSHAVCAPMEWRRFPSVHPGTIGSRGTVVSISGLINQERTADPKQLLGSPGIGKIGRQSIASTQYEISIATLSYPEYLCLSTSSNSTPHREFAGPGRILEVRRLAFLNAGQNHVSRVPTSAPMRSNAFFCTPMRGRCGAMHESGTANLTSVPYLKKLSCRKKITPKTSLSSAPMRVPALGSVLRSHAYTCLAAHSRKGAGSEELKSMGSFSSRRIHSWK